MDLRSVANRIPDNSFLKEIYNRLADDAGTSLLVGDSQVGYSHSEAVIKEVTSDTWNKILGDCIANGEEFQSLEEARSSTVVDIQKRLDQLAHKRLVGDEYRNEMSGVNTLIDSQMYNRVSTPISISPFEATALFSSGGLATYITEKKSEGLVDDGIHFQTRSKYWNKNRIEALEEEADRTKLAQKAGESIRDSLIYGGSLLFPFFASDTALTMEVPNAVPLKKGIIRWSCVDRWNTVFVPELDITAADYLNAATLYVPISGFAVHTSRAVLCRPRMLPYWGAIRQIGWGVSDFVSYIRALFAYNTLLMSVPQMAQQMSLLLFSMPLDALTASIGPDKVRQLQELNQAEMKRWSVTQPQAINAVGEVKALERSFSGFADFYASLKSDLSVQSGVSEPILFHTQDKGFSDNTNRSLLKDSESMRLFQRRLEPQFDNIVRCLVASTFGPDSEEYKHHSSVHISFDKPIVSTEAEKAETGARFSATVNSLVQGGCCTDAAVKMAMQFFPGFSYDDDVIAQVKEDDKHRRDMEKKASEKPAAGGGTGNTKASTGKNTGKDTK